MLEVLQDLDLSQRALRVGEVLEGLVDLLDRHLLARRVVHRAAHHTVRPVARQHLVINITLTLTLTLTLTQTQTNKAHEVARQHLTLTLP